MCHLCSVYLTRKSLPLTTSVPSGKHCQLRYYIYYICHASERTPQPRHALFPEKVTVARLTIPVSTTISRTSLMNITHAWTNPARPTWCKSPLNLQEKLTDSHLEEIRSWWRVEQRGKGCCVCTIINILIPLSMCVHVTAYSASICLHDDRENISLPSEWNPAGDKNLGLTHTVNSGMKA